MELLLRLPDRLEWSAGAVCAHLPRAPCPGVALQVRFSPIPNATQAIGAPAGAIRLAVEARCSARYERRRAVAGRRR